MSHPYFPEERPRSIAETMYQLEKDMYRGDNNLPGVTTRLKLLEDCMETLLEQLKEERKDKKKKDLLILGIGLTGICSLVVEMIMATHK